MQEPRFWDIFKVRSFLYIHFP